MTPPTDADENGRGSPKSNWLFIRNEFGAAAVRVDDGANGPRLCVCDQASGSTIYLDPLELTSLARSRHAMLESLMIPEAYMTETDEWAAYPH